MFDFTGKVVVVTGAEKGLGKGMAEAFAKCGAKVVIVGFDEEEGKKAETEINAYGQAYFAKADITNEEEVGKLPDIIENVFGLTDVLVNNAGIIVKGAITEVAMDAWDKVMNVNVRGTILMTNALIQHMLKKQSGVIINISSEAGIVAFAGQVAYNVSKAAVLHLAKSIAIDYADQGIRANVVAPGTTFTPLVENVLKNSADPDAAMAGWTDRPLHRLGKIDEIAAAVLCMASDDLGYATGSVLSIDGGRTARS